MAQSYFAGLHRSVGSQCNISVLRVIFSAEKSESPDQVLGVSIPDRTDGLGSN